MPSIGAWNLRSCLAQVSGAKIKTNESKKSHSFLYEFLQPPFVAGASKAFGIGLSLQRPHDAAPARAVVQHLPQGEKNKKKKNNTLKIKNAIKQAKDVWNSFVAPPGKLQLFWKTVAAGAQYRNHPVRLRALAVFCI